MSTDLAAPPQAGRPAGGPDGLEVIPARRWRLQHYLAVAGVAFLGWGAWTVIAWLADGPEANTRYRDPGSMAYHVAKGQEVFYVGLVVVLGAWVIRGCLRERRLTFDAQLCLAGILAYWMDPFYNFLVPTVLYSSNFVNVGSWCGHAPFVVNKACGASPEPLLVLGSIYLVGFLLAAIVGGWILRTLQARFPHWSPAQRIVALVAFAGACGVVIDGSAMRLNLWNSFVSPTFTIWDSSHRYPLLMFVDAALFFAGPSLLRHYKDDRGRTILERGLDHMKPGPRGALSFLSLVGFVQVLVFVVTAVVCAPLGLYARNSPRYPDHIMNATCDIGDIHGTPYGPCPGTPGFRAPIRQLPNNKRP